MAKGKKYTDATKKFDRDQLFTPAEAVELVRGLGTATFDESIELAMRLGVDPRKADQIVRGTVALPSGTGKDVRVAVFANGDAAAEARAAGADHVGGEELAAEVEGRHARLRRGHLHPGAHAPRGQARAGCSGPRGLMPNPKTGTVTTEVGKAVGEFKGGKVEYRTDRYGNIHVPIGKVSFEADALQANFRAVLDEVQRAKPASAKGRYLRKISLSPTMGPSVRIDINRLKVPEPPATPDGPARRASCPTR